MKIVYNCVTQVSIPFMAQYKSGAFHTMTMPDLYTTPFVL